MMVDIKTYSKIEAETYSNNRKDYSHTDDVVFGQLKKIGVENKKILDLGCGDGSYSQHLAELGAEFVTGIDASSAMIEIANRNKTCSNTKFLKESSDQLSIKNDTQDIVFSNFVIHYLKIPLKTFKEVYRVLKPGGYFIATLNIFETECVKLHNTEIPLRINEDVTVINLIKTDREILNGMTESELVLKKYIPIDSSYLSVGSDYRHKEKIKKVRNMMLVARKPDT